MMINCPKCGMDLAPYGFARDGHANGSGDVSEPIGISEEARKSAEAIAEELFAIGWAAPNDAQWDKLTKWWAEKQLATTPLQKRIEELEKQLLAMRARKELETK